MLQPNTAHITLRVQPNASGSEVAGWHGDVLRVRVSEPPAGGKANAAVVELLANCLGVHKRDVHIVRGRGSRDKVVQVAGMRNEELRRRLGDWIGSIGPNDS